MFDWLGFKKGLPLWWSYRLNREMKEDVEEIFEGIAHTRMQILKTWVESSWSHLERLQPGVWNPGGSEGAGSWNEAAANQALEQMRRRAVDFSELFVLDQQLTVRYSTYAKHIGRSYVSGGDWKRGLDYAREGRKCLYGPFVDALTLEIGPSSSSFHDAVTLLFLLPLMEGGVCKGLLCGRVPNDVLGDLIQRESGHVYPDSGDNYIFMAQAHLNTHIAPGTALSRSRFEDMTFTHGDNLKEGVRTDYGIVSVKHHTELELRFTDPATKELHPGVANTIASGSNLFVAFPGYSDYRHIPVIGKGVTFQLPHCPDVWGMMCEGDLEEVYRIRGLSWKLTRMQLWMGLGMIALNGLAVWAASQMSSLVLTELGVVLLNVIYGLFGLMLTRRGVMRPAVDRIHKLSRFIRINAEGEGDLTQRLAIAQFDNDETKELAKWINNMIDSLEGIMQRVKQAAGDVQASQQLLVESTESTEASSQRMNDKIHGMIRGIRLQLKDLDVAKDVSRNMSGTLRDLELKAGEQIAVAQEEVERIGGKMQHIQTKVEETNRTIHSFLRTTEEIGGLLRTIEEISAQTNLLALNASIEAARVGEHGKGFAVVAGEIRKLADLTKSTTTQITETLQMIGKSAQEAFESMEEGTRVVAEGTEMVATASDILQQAGSGDSLKTQVVDEMVELMEKIAAVSIENRKVSAEVERTVQELQQDMQHVRGTSGNVDSITRSLLLLVNQFRLTDKRRR
ncbi:methyl-accepting chemotaxis protein [Paenibacillus athensensis]|uniref:Methyl-accepting chemotaxis protein n=1 Tax=Paenibacillus athensensis TaxID=1967502 RepID=A0A4Y8Q9D1_9BACL|nr:methyl-accepting chemotaxis protein [Paenibacillus athensensis]MCD1258909.1 methyl-accepting chemotaxis protein [Paenibacillus athensensis]